MPPDAIVWDIPLDSTVPDIGVVLQARLGHREQEIVVLDAVSPHLRLVSSDRSVRGSLPSGEGPAEVTDPIAVAVWQDTAVVASGNLELKIVDLRDGAVATFASGRRAVLGLARGCGSDLMEYAPERMPDSAGGWSYLSQVVRVGDSTVHQRLLLDDGPRDQLVAKGRPSGIVGAGNSVLIRHDFGKPRVLRSRCSSEGAVELAELWELDHGMPRVSIPREGGRPHLVGDHLLLPAGIAQLGQDTVVLASFRLSDRKGGQGSTRFEILTTGSRAHVDVVGHWILRDSAADGRILLERTGAAPRLFIVRAPELTRALLALVPI
ncbi:MAG: hypothetical protein U0974_06785 [Gemmatimonadales bacterium]|nr:hypothetical protein [Gemmatimonadales bacterium]MDZ4389419.1 hypothetical protein [Gemmatimonadales bacterium]